LLVTKKRQKKDRLAKKPEEFLDRKTIRNSYIAAVKDTLNCAKQQNRISANVASEKSIRVPKKKKREKGFTREEAQLILRATTAAPQADISPEYAKARRWVP
jgi:hypothetical protein